ncbi:ATP-binding protein [Oleidesulfovibrio alaskensis]|jgi:signal transduction histidine kinase|uniref:ATP-binding protein n=1 Tax=Oleidesulfovibrio alaskensis TaxID=58180 RepID=UPI001A46626E|nr:HAMP domain-containing sensor histidine kinase [Oleidesulfovibrio alaskensis]MBL3582424.1 HAMP domain-containing histidine kinase [Oleidesulfovibrio alaskensis]
MTELLHHRQPRRCNAGPLYAVTDSDGVFVVVSAGFASLMHGAGVMPDAALTGRPAAAVLARLTPAPQMPLTAVWNGKVWLDFYGLLHVEIVPFTACACKEGRAAWHLIQLLPDAAEACMDCAGRTARGLAHDFNNALASVMGFAELAAGQAGHGGSSELLHRSLANVLKGCGRAGAVLEKARAVAGRIPLNLTRHSACALLQQWTDTRRAALPDSVQLCTGTLQALPAITADARWLEKAFAAVWDNALMAMRGTGGTLRVECRAGQGYDGRAYVFMDVTDTGCGMDMQTCREAVEPFFSGWENTAGQTSAGGQGWGLSLAWGVLRAHGGGLEISAQPLAGCRVSFRLPAACEG